MKDGLAMVLDRAFALAALAIWAAVVVIIGLVGVVVLAGAWVVVSVEECVAAQWRRM